MQLPKLIFSACKRSFPLSHFSFAILNRLELLLNFFLVLVVSAVGMAALLSVFFIQSAHPLFKLSEFSFMLSPQGVFVLIGTELRFIHEIGSRLGGICQEPLRFQLRQPDLFLAPITIEKTVERKPKSRAYDKSN